VLDDAGNASSAAEVAYRFVADEHVAGVVGPMTSDTVLAAAPIYHSGRLTHISPAASTPRATEAGYDTFYRTVSNDIVQAREAARLAVTYLGCKAIAVVHDGTAFGQPLAEIFREHCVALGARISLFERIEKGQTDFLATIARVAEAGPDLIYCALIEAEGARFAMQLRRAGMMTPLFGTDALKPSRFLETPDYPAPGPFYTSASTDITRAQSAASFHQAFGAYSIYTAEAYDAACILIEAIRRSASRDREAVRKEVAGTAGWPGASGVITFDAHGDLAEPHLDFYWVDGGRLRFVGATHDLGQG
jgi:branched-chain amino acid transport system substrate-binding protein